MTDPIGYLTVLRLADGSYDLTDGYCGIWDSRALADEDSADPEQAGRLCKGERWVTCAVVPIGDGRG